MTTSAAAPRGHTPGPWRFGENVGKRPRWEIVEGADDTPVAVIQRFKGGRPLPKGEPEANASLIAAAPALLAALENALLSLETDGPASAAAALNTHGRAAIKLATGAP